MASPSGFLSLYTRLQDEKGLPLVAKIKVHSRRDSNPRPGGEPGTLEEAHGRNTAGTRDGESEQERPRDQRDEGMGLPVLLYPL